MNTATQAASSALNHRGGIGSHIILPGQSCRSSLQTGLGQLDGRVLRFIYWKVEYLKTSSDTWGPSLTGWMVGTARRIERSSQSKQ